MDGIPVCNAGAEAGCDAAIDLTCSRQPRAWDAGAGAQSRAHSRLYLTSPPCLDEKPGEVGHHLPLLSVAVYPFNGLPQSTRQESPPPSPTEIQCSCCGAFGATNATALSLTISSPSKSTDTRSNRPLARPLGSDGLAPDLESILPLVTEVLSLQWKKGETYFYITISSFSSLTTFPPPEFSFTPASARDTPGPPITLGP
jgi:hypothetical protein